MTNQKKLLDIFDFILDVKTIVPDNEVYQWCFHSSDDAPKFSAWEKGAGANGAALFTIDSEGAFPLKSGKYNRTTIKEMTAILDEWLCKDAA